MGFDTDPLFRTHTLFEAMSFRSSPDNEIIVTDDWAVFRVPDSETAEGRSPGSYGGFHQTGTEHMPARPPFRLTIRDRREFVDEMQRYIFTGKVSRFL
jgi:hypothetical protein